jgi:hypothetical protein
MNEFQEAFS